MSEEFNTAHRIEIDFPKTVQLPHDWEYKLNLLVDEVCEHYEKRNPGRVMWPAGHGSKVNWSRMDAAFLGRTPAPDAPIGGEPTYDDDVYEISVSERERYAGEPDLKWVPKFKHVLIIQRIPLTKQRFFNPMFAWFDFWVGAFWDKKQRRLYIFPIPMVGFYLQFKQSIP